MKKLLLSSFVILGVSLTFVWADSYDGPFCFEPKDYMSAKYGTDEEQTVKEKEMRGTCKKVEFARFVSLDNSVIGYHFVSWQRENEFSDEKRMDKVATTSRTIQEDYDTELYITRTLPYETNLLPVWYMASEDPFDSRDEGRASSDSPSSLFIDHYGRNTPYPYAKGSTKLGIATYVPVTSPITKIIEHWRITKMPNGFMLIKERTETYLDDGSVRVISKSEPVATSTDPVVEKKSGFISRFLSLFRNLF